MGRSNSPSKALPRRTVLRPEERLRLLAGGMGDHAIVELDTEGRIASWNAEAEHLLLHTEGEIVGRHFSCFFTPEDIQSGVPDRELKAARERGRLAADRWCVRKDGSQFWSSGVIMTLDDGGFRGYAKLFRDLTAQQLVEDDLRKSEERFRKLAEQFEGLNKRKDDFLAMLSHELRNPLSPVLTALHVLRQDPTDNPLQLQARNIVERQVWQLAHLVDDLLEVSRLNVGKIHLRKERVECRVALERASESYRPLIDARQHHFSLSLPDHPVWIHADPTRLEQIVVNLLSNAAKYTPERGRISLILHQENDQAVLRVRDSGIGIAPELLPRVFDLFTQAEQGLAHSQGGLGVGLALVKALVKMHDGTVQVRSAGLDRGSEFIVRLPVIEGQETPLSNAAAPATPRSATLRLLVVDDNIDATESLAMLLRMDHHDVATAYTGRGALQAAVKHHPHVILLDIGLPDVDGYHVAKQLREQPESKDVLLIALTGYAQESDKKRAREAGFDHHLVKPVDPSQLQKLLALVEREPHS